MEDAQTLGLAEIEGHALLVAIERVEEHAVVLCEVERPDVAGEVAALRRLDLDDLRALIGEEHRAEGARAVLLDGEHAHTCEGEGHRCRLR